MTEMFIIIYPSRIYGSFEDDCVVGKWLGEGKGQWGLGTKSILDGKCRGSNIGLCVSTNVSWKSKSIGRWIFGSLNALVVTNYNCHKCNFNIIYLCYFIYLSHSD